jgi:multidrug efflux pump subunit AcrA (membrane-fusion protein)
MQQPVIKYLFLGLLATSCLACNQAKKEPAAAETPEAPETPVTVTGINTDPMTDSIVLNATSSFLQKNYIKANANGYLQSNFTHPGQFVKQGQALFTIKTKEAETIGNAVNKLDSTFRFTGTNSIRAGENGFITLLSHQAGDYVQDGEQLAVISDVNSFAFLLDLPYEQRPLLQNRKTVDLVLPDGEHFIGIISGTLPSVDPSSQAQSIIIKINSSHPIPENLVAKVKMLKDLKEHPVTLPKATVLSDETQSNFWIMKMIDSSTAVKVPVKKGLENNNRVEILSPVLTADDLVLLSGNYGLSDTAKVKIFSPGNTNEH